MLLTTNKANISATNLYLFCAVLFMSCHLWLSLVLFLFLFFITFSFSFLLTFFTDHVFVGSLVSGMISVCKSARMHAFSFESIFDFGLNSWPNQLIPGDIFWVRDDCVLSFALFWGWHDPTALLTYCGAPSKSLHYVLPPLLWPLPYCGLQLHPHCPARPRPPVSTTFSSHRLHLFIEIDFVAMMMEACIAAVGLSLN